MNDRPKINSNLHPCYSYKTAACRFYGKPTHETHIMNAMPTKDPLLRCSECVTADTICSRIREKRNRIQWDHEHTTSLTRKEQLEDMMSSMDELCDTMSQPTPLLDSVLQSMVQRRCLQVNQDRSTNNTRSTHIPIPTRTNECHHSQASMSQPIPTTTTTPTITLHGFRPHSSHHAYPVSATNIQTITPNARPSSSGYYEFHDRDDF